MSSQASIHIPTPPDPHELRWMLFVDGENFTIRGQRIASDRGLSLVPGQYWRADSFLWFQNRSPLFFGTDWMRHMALRSAESSDHFPNLRPRMVRGYYYATARGDDKARAEITQALWEIGFTPKVFKKPDPDKKSKAVDIAFTTDVLSHAYQNNYDAAFLIAGDEDYVPLVEELKHHGRFVAVGFFTGKESGLSPALRLASDAFADLTELFVRGLQKAARKAKAAHRLRVLSCAKAQRRNGARAGRNPR